MKATTKRTMSILASIILLIGSVFVYASFIKPAYEEVSNLKTKSVNLEQSFNSYQSLNNQFQNLLNEYKNLGDLAKQISLILPSNLDTAYVLSQITGIAGLNNLGIQSLSVKQLAIEPSSEPFTRGLGVLGIDLRAGGSYDNFKAFLNGLETNVMISNPINFKVEKQGDNLVYTMTIEAYYQAE
ncbi:MAG: hypothetical protein UU85_C0008G0004 [Candidatus Wolfebacteria bacterium GW2011_GWA2_42_10]|uniref:Uncharacterized protein n=2 Tax=Candidatus Wolfeibacteriota TaxID=1752735 RepID=A0A0G0XJE3_9BACT|nr:MAG: hypothetical protein UU38_C0003G0199 [Candidatus Wolfebacteria bacterium GW2011_GWB1_41_12]KKS25050.1 MAG: hypothetical protein UU85_C0008G0004 [Candidatus Wolfebacteria bacterium GW2011_GWA2_42_10]KKT56359.1 MAG: hypothetical protein UW50_C0002G0036 [Candidatus Wolfebacteria bacterium GW2011_GWA1_44_24]